jgi:hypothetical protein
MTITNTSTCPKCRGTLKYYDRVDRLVRTKGGLKTRIKLKRFRCTSCNGLHRELPEFIFPYKHYESHVIKGVLAGYITSETLGFEDFPRENTMSRWRDNNSLLYERSDIYESQNYI